MNYTYIVKCADGTLYEGFSTKEEAMRREYEIKQFTRNKKLELLSF